MSGTALEIWDFAVQVHAVKKKKGISFAMKIVVLNVQGFFYLTDYSRSPAFAHFSQPSLACASRLQVFVICLLIFVFSSFWSLLLFLLVDFPVLPFSSDIIGFFIDSMALTFFFLFHLQLHFCLPFWTVCSCSNKLQCLLSFKLKPYPLGLSWSADQIVKPAAFLLCCSTASSVILSNDSKTERFSSCFSAFSMSKFPYSVPPGPLKP